MRSPTPVTNGRYHHSATSVKNATSRGDNAVPRPRRTFSVVSATSRRSGSKPPAKVLRHDSVTPKPRPRNAVETSSIGYAAAFPSTATLATRIVIDAMSAAMPASNRRLRPNRRDNSGSKSDPVIAMMTCGTKMSPYWLFDRS
jgi:hypothetical protein